MGCTTKVQQRNIESHLQSATRLHLDLACAKLNNTQEELRDTKRKLEEKFNVCQNEFKETTRKLEEKIDTLENRLMQCPEIKARGTGCRAVSFPINLGYRPYQR